MTAFSTNHITKEKTARWLHPLAWWIWGLTAATIAIVSENWVIHLTIFTAIMTVIYTKRPNASWGNSLSILLRLVLFIIGFRLMIEIVFGVHFGGPILLALPEVHLPNWLGGIELGGSIGATGALSAFLHGFKLATVLVSAAAPATLIPPNLLLKSLPNAIYEAGLVTVIAVGFLPTLSADVRRIRSSSALRGKPAVGIRQNIRLMMPLIDSSLNRAVTLANAMESRGFGKTKMNVVNSNIIGLSLICGLFLLLISIYQILRNRFDNISFLIMILAISTISISIIVGGRIRLRTRFEKLVFAPHEMLIIASSLLVVWLGLSQPLILPIFIPILLLCLLAPIWIAPPIPKGFQK